MLDGILAEVVLYCGILVQVDIKGTSELSESESDYNMFSSIVLMVVVS